MLDGAAQRTGAVLLVVALLDEQRLGVGGERERDLALGDPLGEAGGLELDDLHEIVLVERPEEHDVRDAVEELGLEDPLGFLEHLLAHLLGIVEVHRRGGEAHRRLALQELRADVARHDDDRVPEIDRATERVGEPAVLEDLEEDLDDVRGCLKKSCKYTSDNITNQG